MSNWDRKIIIEKIRSSADRYGATNPQQLKQLMFGCEKSPETEVFYGLFSFFYDPSLQENKYERQQLSGTILLSLAPSSPLALDGSIYAAATIWDLSIEELPWYWCKIFGKEAVANFLENHISDCTDKHVIKSFETMLFWAKGYKNGA